MDQASTEADLPTGSKDDNSGNNRLNFIKTDVSSWASLRALFTAAITQHGHIDHVFAAAGIGGMRANYLGEQFDDETGELLEPVTTTLDINLRGVINTAYLGLYHFRQQVAAAVKQQQQQQQTTEETTTDSPPKELSSPKEGTETEATDTQINNDTPSSQPSPPSPPIFSGSVVLAASATSFVPFRNVDYGTAKHGVLGFMRDLAIPLAEHFNSKSGIHLRINSIAPSWTRTGMVTEEAIESTGYGDILQDAEVVARSVLLLMVDETRHGQLVYSRQGRMWEVDGAFKRLAREVSGEVDEDVVSIAFPFSHLLLFFLYLRPSVVCISLLGLLGLHRRICPETRC